MTGDEGGVGNVTLLGNTGGGGGDTPGVFCDWVGGGVDSLLECGWLFVAAIGCVGVATGALAGSLAVLLTETGAGAGGT